MSPQLLAETPYIESPEISLSTNIMLLLRGITRQPLEGNSITLPHPYVSMDILQTLNWSHKEAELY